MRDRDESSYELRAYCTLIMELGCLSHIFLERLSDRTEAMGRILDGLADQMRKEQDK